MTDFIEFFSDVVKHMSSFKDDIVTIYLDYDGDKIVATGNHPKRRLFYRMEANPSVSFEMLAHGVFGSIPYLKAILANSLMKEFPTVEFEYSDDHKCIKR